MSDNDENENVGCTAVLCKEELPYVKTASSPTCTPRRASHEGTDNSGRSTTARRVLRDDTDELERSTSGRRHRHISVSSSSDSDSKHPRLSSDGRQSIRRRRSGSSCPGSSDRHRRQAARKSASSSGSRSGSRSYIRCDKFDGKTCVDTYLAKFESCAEYNNWTAKDKADNLKSALTGNAANLRQGNTRATYSEVVGLLQRRYGNSQQHEKYKLELKSRRRRPDEDIQSLAQQVERLVHRAYPRALADIRETLSLDSFIDALDDPPLQCRLREREPVTLNEAVATALRLGAINLSTLRGKEMSRKQFRAVKTDHADEGRKRDSLKRPSPNSAEKRTSAGRGKRSPRKEQPATAETQRAFRGQLQRQDNEISRLRQKLVEMSRAVFTPSTPTKAPSSPLLVQAAEAQPYYNDTPSVHGASPAYVYQTAPYPAQSMPPMPVQTGSGIPPQRSTSVTSPSWSNDSVAQGRQPAQQGFVNSDFASQRQPSAPQSSTVSSPNATPTSERRNFSRDSSVVCYNCNTPGHMQRFCPARRSGLNANAGSYQPRPPMQTRAASSEFGREGLYPGQI